MITATVVGGEQVIERLQALGPTLREALRAAVTAEAVRLTRYVKEEKLSGQVLHVRTGTLRRKINYVVHETPSAITASVGVQLAYAAIHEYGFDGTETVRAHVRRVAGRDVKGRIALSRARLTPSGQIVTSRRGTTGTGIAFVHEFTRHLHMPERSFLRSSLKENELSIREHLQAAVREALPS